MVVRPLAPLFAVLTLPSLVACGPRCVGATCPDAGDDPTDDTGGVDDTGTPTPGDPDDLPLPTVRDCSVTFRMVAPNGTRRLSVAGDVNDWQPADLEGPDADGFWTADLGELAPGTYAYKRLYDGTWEGELSLDTPLQWAGGVENRQLRVGDCDKPLLRPVSSEATPDGTVRATIQFARAASGAALRANGITATIGTRSVTPVVDADAQTITVEATGLPEGKHTVRVTAIDADGVASENEVFTPLWVEPEPFEWTDGAMYLIFVDRFRDGDGEADSVDGVDFRANYTGGDLLGVLQALEDGWFEAMGIRSIWLSPLYENAEGGWDGQADDKRYAGYHGYWPTKARAVETRFRDDGKAADARLHDVVAEAHARGIRVVMDVVLNHVHQDHEYTTAHPDWFGPGCVCGAEGCGWEDKAIECEFTPYMPDLDHTNPAITEQLVQDTLWWMRTFDLDGLRIDAVKHMHRVMTVNLRHALRDEIERGGGAHVYTVGETFTGGGAQAELTQRIGPYEMDAQFDFPFYWSVRSVFAQGASMRTLEDTIKAGRAAWGDAPMSPFAGNHDIPRLATEIAGNSQGGWGFTPDLMAEGGSSVTQPDLIGRIRGALAVTLTQPGVPLLYYGDEIGLAGAGDPDNRRRMSFPPFLSANQTTLLDDVRAIGQARAELPQLQRGGFTPLWVDDDFIAYARTHEGSAVYVLVSKGGSRTTEIPVQGTAGDGSTFTDRLDAGRTVTIQDGLLRVPLSGHDVAILAP